MLCDFSLIKKLYLIKKFCRVKAVKLKVSGFDPPWCKATDNYCALWRFQ